MLDLLRMTATSVLNAHVNDFGCARRVNARGRASASRWPNTTSRRYELPPEIDAIAAANPSLLAYDRPAPGGSGHFPKPIGAANITGTSRYFAREDHTHRGAAGTHSHPEPVVRFAPVTLTDGAPITADAARGDYFRVNLRGNRVLVAPTDGIDGQRILIEALASDAQRTLTVNASILLTTGITAPTTIAIGKRWFGGMVYVSAIGW